MDALRRLRDAVSAGHEIKLDDGNLVFKDGTKLPITTPTAYHPDRNDQPYELGALWHCATNAAMSYGAQRKGASSMGISAIKRMDYKDVIAYVTGVIDTSDAVKEVDLFDSLPGPEDAGDAKAPLIEAGEGEDGEGDAPALGADEEISVPTVVQDGEQALLAEAEAARTVTTVKDILGRERPQRTRLSIMLASTRTHFKEVETLFKDGERVAAKLTKDAQEQNKNKRSHSHVEKTFDKRRKQTLQYQNEKWNQDAGKIEAASLKGTGYEEHKIDAGGSMMSRGGAPRSSRGESEARHRTAPAQAHRSAGGARRSSTGSTASGPEIIIVTPGAKALVNIFNAKQFFASRKWYNAVELRKAGATRKKYVDFNLPSSSGGSGKVYRVVDNPSSLRGEEWSRVVAVFLNAGNTWQFKNWPKALQEPSRLFQKVCGFYLHWDDEVMDPKVPAWNVHILSLSKTKRHHDSRVVSTVWAYLGRFQTKIKAVRDLDKREAKKKAGSSSGSHHRGRR